MVQKTKSKVSVFSSCFKKFIEIKQNSDKYKNVCKKVGKLFFDFKELYVFI